MWSRTIMRTGSSALRGATFSNSIFIGMEHARWRVPLALSTCSELTNYDQPAQQDYRVTRPVQIIAGPSAKVQEMQ